MSFVPDPRGRVLVVDDEPLQTTLLKGMLDAHYDVETLNDDNLTFRYIRDFDPEVLLLDLVMPGLGGVNILSRLRNSSSVYRFLPVILITAHGNDGNLVRAYGEGASEFIRKGEFDNLFLSTRVASHIKNYREIKKLEDKISEERSSAMQTQLKLVEALAREMKNRDPNLGQHTQRVQEASRAIARLLGNDNLYCDTIFHTSALRDIGDIRTPEEYLLKRDATEEDFNGYFKRHIEQGLQILTDSKLDEEDPTVRMSRKVIGFHHENYDGTGYQGLVGEEIPLCASIVRFVDVFYSLITRSCYREPISFENAHDFVLNGSQEAGISPNNFNPDVLLAFRENAELFHSIASKYVN